MAITLQRARVTAAQLAGCRRSIAELDRLCSFEMVPVSEHLDLDWAGDGLVRMCEIGGLGAAAALRQAKDGAEEVNPAYGDHPDGVMEPPRYNAAKDVAMIAAVLRDIDVYRLLAAVPSDLKPLLGEPFETMDGDPRGYLAEHFIALRRFYGIAAERNLAVVAWRD